MSDDNKEKEIILEAGDEFGDGTVKEISPAVPTTAERAAKAGFELIKNPKALNATARQAVSVLTPIAVSLRGNSIIRGFDDKWKAMSPEDKTATLNDPSLLKKIFGGPFYSKHKFDQYFLGGLVLLGAIGGPEDDEIIKAVYSPGWAEKAIQALFNIGKFINPELAPIAEGINIYATVKDSGLKVAEAVRVKARVPARQEQTHEATADATPDTVVAPHQKRTGTDG